MSHHRLRDLDDDLGAAFRSADIDAPSPDAKIALLGALGLGVGVASTNAATVVATTGKGVASVAPPAAGAGVASAKASAVVIAAKWIVLSGLLVGAATAAVFAAVRHEQPTVVAGASSLPVPAVRPSAAAVTGRPPPIEAPASAEPQAPVVSVEALPPAPTIAPRITTPIVASSASSTEVSPEPALFAGQSSAAEPTVAEEIADLDRARKELAAGQPAKAVAILERHRARFPNGVMDEEASVLLIEALARAGEAERARSLGKAFLAARPASPLAARVRRIVDAP